MPLIDRFLPRTEFASYEDFAENFRIEVPENFDFARDVVDAQALADPIKRALVYCTDDPACDRTFTFSDISELSKRAARWFLENGIAAGDRVLTLARRRWEYWIVAVALNRIGASPVPCSIQMTTKDLAYRVEVAHAKMILALDDAFVLDQLRSIPAQCPCLTGGIALIGDGEPSEHRSFTQEFQACEPWEGSTDAGNADEMVVYFTSGTSGYPKMAVHNRTYPLGHIVTARYMQNCIDGGLHLTQTDSGWAKFGWGNIYGQWICGTAILGYDPERFHTRNMMRILETHRPTTMCVPPTMYRFLLHDGLKREHVASVQWFATAGEPLSGEVNKKFEELTGHPIHEGFGQSEGTPIMCGWPWLPVRPSSMGKPSPLYDVHLVSPDGSDVAHGETGEVVIRVPAGTPQLGLLDYYWLDGQRIDPVRDGLYHTGDTAYQDEDGYFWYVGRVDDMIKCSGYRIGPFEIESVLNTHPAVRESAIVGAPDPIRGQIVCAVLTLRPGFSPSDALTEELQRYVKHSTAPYKYPRKIVYLDDLPKTTSGKIIRRQARERAKEAVEAVRCQGL